MSKRLVLGLAIMAGTALFVACGEEPAPAPTAPKAPTTAAAATAAATAAVTAATATAPAP